MPATSHSVAQPVMQRRFAGGAHRTVSRTRGPSSEPDEDCPTSNLTIRPRQRHRLLPGVEPVPAVLPRPVESGQFTSIRHGERLAEIGRRPRSAPSATAFDQTLAETVNGHYKAELIRGPARIGAWQSVEDVELTALS